MAQAMKTFSPQLPDHAVDALNQRLRGDLIRPGDTAYDQARQVWNAAVDRFPALIVRPRDANDVMAAVTFARSYQLPLAVRSGGHSVAGYGTVDDGLVVDLSQMQRLEIDRRQGIATAETGLTWGAFNTQTHEAGLATPGPDVSTVGLGGNTLGGGYGWLSRQFGMTIDNVLAAEVVTAGGQLLRASEDDNPDLFWALRGGGGNFGIATQFQLRLHPVSTVMGGVLAYPASPEVLRDYVEAAGTAPDELTTLSSLLNAPPLPFIPAEAHGTPVLMIVASYTGDPGSSDQAYAQLRRLGGAKPIADTVASIPYPALFKLSDVASARQPQAIRAGFMRDLDEATIDAMLDAVEHPSSPFSKVMLRVLDGAIARVPAEETAFSHRDLPIYFAINNVWEEGPGQDPDRHVAWTEDLWRRLAPRTDGAYVNFLGDEGDERVRDAYAPATLARLAEIKRRYDPDNVFRLNANIVPA